MSQLRQIVDAVVNGAMRIPGAQPLGRSLAYGLTRSQLLSDKNRMRVHNLIGVKVIPRGVVRARVPIPELPGVNLSLELGLADELSRFWYFFGYDHYEVSVRCTLAALVAALPPDPQWRFLDVGGNIGYFTLYLAALARAGEQGRGTFLRAEPACVPHAGAQSRAQSRPSRHAERGGGERRAGDVRPVPGGRIVRPQQRQPYLRRRRARRLRASQDARAGRLLRENRREGRDRKVGLRGRRGEGARGPGTHGRTRFAAYRH